MAQINLGDRLKKRAGWASWVVAAIVAYASYAYPELVERVWRPLCAVLLGCGGCAVIWMARREASPAGLVVGSIVGIGCVATALFLAVGVYRCGVDFRGCK